MPSVIYRDPKIKINAVVYKDTTVRVKKLVVGTPVKRVTSGAFNIDNLAGVSTTGKTAGSILAYNASDTNWSTTNFATGNNISIAFDSAANTFTFGTNAALTNVTSLDATTTSTVRSTISVTDAGGDGSLAYNNSTGVVTYTGPSASEARAHVSAVDAGGDGSFTYNSGTGAFTYTGPSAAEVRAHISANKGLSISSGELNIDSANVKGMFSGGTGVTYNDGVISIGQPVATTSDVTFNDVIISGDLTVSGTQTTVNTETILLADNVIVVNSNATGSPTENGGIEVERGDATNKTLIWNETDDKWTVGSETFVAERFEGDVDGALLVDVYNNTGSTLSKGDAVYLTGSNNGDNPHVALADADDASKMPALGIVKNNIGNNSVGQVTTSGVINDAQHGYTLGADLYISSTAGQLTTTKPTGEANLIQKIGKVVSSNHIIVQGAFRTNQTPNLNDGKIFIGNGSNQSVTSTLDTSIVPENSNLYHTTARARGAVSVTDAGGDGSLSYNTSTGVITYTGASAAEVRAHLTANKGLSVTDGEFNIDSANVRGMFSASGDLSYNSGTGQFSVDVENVYTKANFDSDLGLANTGQLPEGSNLYYTDARVDARITTASVTATGALMDSELTDLAGVKGVTISTLQPKPSEGAFVDGDKTKLDGIEASADVTDTANVTSAGALMDSELTDLAGVKGVTISTLQPKPSEGAFVDGDKTKLDAIENGATADQTDAEIKTAYENNSDTNAFTDAEKTKLTNIEASADVTDTANVTSAGALMDSELTDLAGVKGVTISTLQVKPTEGAFVDGDKTKLDAIEASADVTDTANVTAAGALMDSELTDLAGVKGVTISTLQVKPSEGAFANGDKTKLDGIEASADVTDTANVTSAGALMDSELASIADVKALDQSVVSGATPTFTTTNFTDATDKRFMTDAQESKLDGIEASATADQTDAEIRAAVEAATDSNVFTDADHTKLNAIEASADVTDTANVTAAGALMDSEVDADIKTLSLPANTTISAFGKTLVDDADAATARTTLGVDASGTDNSTDVTLAGSLDYITISGQEITRNAINLSTDVTGTLPVGNMAATALTTVQTAANESAHLALTAQEGDVVVRSDQNKTYMHNGGTAGTMDDYTLLATPTDAVTSVNGNTGVVTVTENVTTNLSITGTDAARTIVSSDGTDAVIPVATDSVSGVMSAADHTKLTGIETSADVTDTANVTAAGALMDSELASIADVKALDQSVISGASPTFGTANMSDATNKRFMTDAQETKLDGIEASADVTDTANVTSAGALMDSELTDLAGVKGVTISTLQPKPSEGAFANGDKTKLDGIEASADVTDTANVTAAGALMDSELTDLAGVKGVTISTLQVKPSEGAFVDGDKTKLDAIEASADVTDTANVTAAGALMDSELTDLAGVKGVTISTLQVKPSEGAFANGDKTKLDGIEASADVTDTANVTSAGAVMDSELTSIADVKALDQSVISGASPNFATTNMTDASNKRFMSDAQETKLDSVESSATADQTAAEILTAVKTVDGASSGLDADLLDGVQGASYLRSDADDTFTGTLNVAGKVAIGDANAVADRELHIQSTTPTIRLEETSTFRRFDITQSVNDTILDYENNMLFKRADNTEIVRFDEDGVDVTGITKTAGTGYNPNTTGWATNAALITTGSYGGGLTFVDGSAGYSLRVENSGADFVIGQGATSGALTQKVKITSSGINVTGKIGLGDADTVADHELHIQSASPTIRLEDTDGNQRFDITQNAGSTNIDYETDMLFKKSDGTEIFRIDGAGVDVTGSNITTGTSGTTQWQAGSSANKLTIAAYDSNIFYHKLSSGNSTSYQVGVEDNIPIYTITNNTIRTTLLGNGNFGIGDSNPAQKLTVNGTIKYTGLRGTGSVTVTNILDEDDMSSNSATALATQQSIKAYVDANAGSMSNAQVRAAVEAATDSNVFTDADHTKLNGIEASATADQTAAEILTAIKTVDGSGSGLDADVLDGIGSGSFLRSDVDDAVNAYSTQIRFPSNTTGATASGDQASLEVRQATGNSDAFMQFHVAGDFAAYFGIDGTTNDLFVGGWSMGANKYKIWHQNNDGSGSGLDADTLDGVQGASYLRSDANDTFTGTLTVTGTIALSSHLDMPDSAKIKLGTSDDFEMYHSGGESWIRDVGTGDLYIDTNSAVHLYSGGNTNMLYAQSGGGVYLYHAGSQKLQTTSSGIDVTGTGEFDSMIVQSAGGYGNIEMGGPNGAYIDLKKPFSDDYDFRIMYDGTASLQTTGNYVQVSTASGYVQIGPQNTSYSHFSTDRSKFYFNKQINVDTGIITSHNEDLKLQRAGSTTNQLLVADGSATFGVELNVPTLRVTGTGDASLSSTAHGLQVGTTGGANIAIDGNEILARNNGAASSLILQNDGGNLSACAGGGTVTFGGALSVPSQILHTGDSNTYMQFHAADQWRVVTGGVERLEVNNTQTTVNQDLDVNGTIDLRADGNTTTARYVHIPRGGGVTFYGDAGASHSITSRNNAGTVADDLNISSYGAVYIMLDKNNNNGSGADFKIYRNGTSTVALTVSGENGNLTAEGDVTAFSDERLKENIKVIPNAIEKVSQIRGVTYTRNDQKDKEKVYAGVIAQEVEKVLPEVVNTTEDDTKTVAYGNMVGLLIEAVKEQQEQINQLKKQIEEMK